MSSGSSCDAGCGSLTVPSAGQEDPREIGGAYHSLRREVESLGPAVEELSKRLESFMVPQPPTVNVEGEPSICEYSCGHATGLREIAIRVRRARIDLTDILQRLQT